MIHLTDMNILNHIAGVATSLPIACAMTTATALHAAHAGDQAPPGDVVVRTPASYDPGTPTPLLIMLHGYGSPSGESMEQWLQLWPHANTNGFLYATPTGNVDLYGNNFWNATDSCCNFGNADVDNVAYLVELIETIKSNYNVDQDRVHLLGYSNGAFMSHRMACEHGDLIASITTIAGVTWNDPEACPATDSVHVLQIHGTNDEVVLYNGGAWDPARPYPGAVETTEQWASKNGCLLEGVESPDRIDFDANVPGAEGRHAEYTNACHPNGSATIWRLEGSTHTIQMTDDARAGIFAFMRNHPKTDAGCTGDVDGDAVIDGADLVQLLGDWGDCTDDPCTTDINGDGTIDGIDVTNLLGAWGPCP